MTIQSRSYYAIFHAIPAVLFYKGLTFSSHSQLIGAFNREMVNTGVFPKEFTRIVKDLFENRQIGDYEVRLFIDHETPETSLKEAKIVVTELTAWLKQQKAF